MESQPVRSITTTDEFASVPIEIDGTRYAIGVMASMNMRSMKMLARGQRRLDEIEAKDEPTEEEGAEYSAILAKLAGLVCNAPADILQKLNDFKLIGIMTAFTMLQASIRQANGANPNTTAAQRQNPSRPTGISSSTRSPGSTRARRRRTGGTSRRSAKSTTH
jgi:hypothetical protein